MVYKMTWLFKVILWLSEFITVMKSTGQLHGQIGPVLWFITD